VRERKPITVAHRFDTIDASGARDTIIGHSYYVDTDVVANDIAGALIKNYTPLERGLQELTEEGKTFWRLPK
jgi:5'(3')-deoxyribonucleotidase